MQRSPYGDRFAKLELGGGAMLDMGCYLVQFAALFLPRADDTVSNITVHATGSVLNGVDTDVAFTISTPNASASYGTSIKRASDFALSIFCEHGKLSIRSPANCPVSAEYVLYADARLDKTQPVPCCGQMELERREFAYPLPMYPALLAPMRGYPNGMGFVYVASAFERCLYTPSCTELHELPMSEQRLIVRLTTKVFDQLSIYQGVTGM
jgi:hypothetical protein